ncbi:PAS domain-containing protein [Roseovarius dicentrarchi]|uniref:PAS domain-containing protein n=1 Tax=Roseovarius dicentrarchi TaxID=2250573 RepID=UPI000DEBF9B1|nr:PAS domain-containing protein [Roseovarius dicentrarchi]
MTRDIHLIDGHTATPLRALAQVAPSLSPHATALADFAAYWQKMRRGTDVPRRSDIDPRGIEALLSNAFIAERIAPGLARLRIAGSHMTDLMGMEVRGMPLSAFITPSHRDALSHHLVSVFDQPATLRLSLASATGPKLTGDMLILPLRSDLGDISRALGCLVTCGNLGRGPRRFDIVDAQVTPLEGAAHPRLATPTLALTSDRRASEPHRAGQKSHLRLVKG